MFVASAVPFFVLWLLCSADAAAIGDKSAKKCGYESCPPIDKTKLNIHLVPHSHDDLGWLNTVDGYYQQSVRHILTTSINELLKNPERRFIYAETGFFWIWWQEQNEATREQVRNLVNEGRLEFVNGGLSMPDEAASHYHSLLDQYTWGFRRLDDLFGSCGRSRVGWQIDPFGHSREVASMFAQFGFDGLFFARLDYQDKERRMDTKTAELMWNASPTLGGKSSLFTSLLYNHYSPPSGLCFDGRFCGQEVDEYNARSKAELVVEHGLEQAEHYKTNNVLFTMGDDFHYTNATAWFSNMDKLIALTKKYYGAKVNIIYSTPSCYLKAVHDNDLTLTTKTDDFFPYASDPHAFWTGYYTSRPTHKYFERFGNNFMQAAKQLSSLTNIKSYEKPLAKLREIMGILQHHDAITGTEKQNVAEDYAKNLHKSIKGVEPLVTDALKKLMGSNDKVQLESCLLLNTSSCEYTEKNSNFVVTLYNPTSQIVSHYVRLPVNGASYKVQNHEGAELESQVVPILNAIKTLPGRKGKSVNELVFKAANIPAFGFQSFYVSKEEGKGDDLKRSVDLPENVKTESLKLKEKALNVDIGKKNYIVATPLAENDLKIQQTFQYYMSSFGRRSGAYLFGPAQLRSYKGKPRMYRKVEGKLVNELHIRISNEASEVIRTYNGEDYIEYDWVVGPLEYGHPSTEVITKFKTDIKNDGIFYTDSNGRDMMKRKLNYRPTWNVSLEEPISGNYYPITSKIYIKDEEKHSRLAVITDRAQGGSSLHDGEIELMVHRRTSRDDNLGVGQSLQEHAFGRPLVVRGQHYVVATRNNEEKQIALEKYLATKLSYQPLHFFTPAEGMSFEQWKKSYNMQGSGVAANLPANVKILTLEPWKDDTILLRLEHLFEKDESEKYSKPVTVNIKDLFSTFTVKSVEETTLGANLKLEELKRLDWNYDKSGLNTQNSAKVDDSFNVMLQPTEIRTFIVKVSYKK